MITALIFSLHHPHRAAAHLAALLGVTGLAAFSSVQASVPSMETNGVVSGDTYSIEVVGYNTTNPANDIYLIQTNLTPTFGTTSNYANDALGGQTLMVTSSETLAGGITTDKFTFSVPTNFVPGGTKDNGGNALNAIQFSIGSYLGGTNPLDLSAAGSGFNATATVISNSGTGMASATVTSSNGNAAFSAFGQTTSPVGSDIANNGVTSLSLTVTYGAVPEPSTNAAVLLGAAGLVGIFMVRARRRARV